jgi:hypothetical protein
MRSAGTAGDTYPLPEDGARLKLAESLSLSPTAGDTYPLPEGVLGLSVLGIEDKDICRPSEARINALAKLLEAANARILELEGSTPATAGTTGEDQ